MLRPKKYVFLALMLLVLGVAVAACGSSGGSSSSSETTTGSESSEGSDATASEEAGNGEDSSSGLKSPGSRKIGVMPVNMGSEFLARAVEQVKETVEPLGWEVVVADGAADPQKMEAGLQSFVSQGVDAIFTMSIGGEEVPQGLAAAKRAEIPVFAIITDVPPTQVKNFAGVFADSNVEMGRIAGDYIGENLPQPVVGWDITENFAGHGYVEGVEKGLAEHGRKYADLRNTPLANLNNAMSENAQAIIQENKGPITFVDLSDFGSTIFMPIFERAGRDDITMVTRYDDPSALRLMEQNPTMLTVVSEGYSYIFDAVETLLGFWTEHKPLPTEPNDKHVAGGKVVSAKDFPEGAEEVYEFAPALEAQLAKWGKTYQLSE